MVDNVLANDSGVPLQHSGNNLRDFYLFYFKKGVSPTSCYFVQDRKCHIQLNPIYAKLLLLFLLFETLKQGGQNDVSTNETTLNKRTASVGKPRWFNSPLLFWDARLPVSAPDSLEEKKNAPGPNLLTLLRNVRDEGVASGAPPLLQ